MLSHSAVSDSYCDLMDCSLSRLLCPWGFSRQEYWSGFLCPPPGDHLNLGIEPRSPALQKDSLPSQPPGRPKYTGVGSLSLLQGSSRRRNRTGVSCIAGRSSTAAAKSLQSCPTLYDPMDCSPPSSLSLGFSRQEHWRGLPFPSPMHESVK